MRVWRRVGVVLWVVALVAGCRPAGEPDEAALESEPAPAAVLERYSFIGRWGVAGREPGQLDAPVRLAVGKDAVYLLDARRGLVQQFALDGTFVAEWPTGEVDADGRRRTAPVDLDVGRSGDVHVLDLAVFRVQRFDSSGALVGEFGGRGRGPEAIRHADAIAVAADGDVYLLDTASARVSKYTAGGQRVAEWAQPGRRYRELFEPADLGIDASHRLYIADTGNVSVKKFAGGGEYVSRWGGRGAGAGQFQQPARIAVTEAGISFVGDLRTGEIRKFSDSGRPLARFGGFGKEDGQFGSLSDLDSEDGRTLYALDAARRSVQVFAPAE